MPANRSRHRQPDDRLIYNLADTYFVGMLNQPHQTAAITVVYSSFVMLTALSNLFGVGGASALSRALG